MPIKKEAKDKSPYLTGQLLLAMPGLGDPRFHKAAIFICAHDENGAMGLVINHILPNLDMTALLKQLNISSEKTDNNITNNIPIMSGGPVETARGFILHSNDFTESDTIKVNQSFSVTGTVDALKEISSGNGPQEMLFILGYAGWSPGQLDEEIQQNAWLVMDADHDVVFDVAPEEMWNKAVARLGIDPAMLSGESGRA